ncbi:MAG: ABC transporter substrate-binding protein [Bacillales bacterium]|nr:ABC transporter substrate-binding protein [Bacillales bacterium]
MKKTKTLLCVSAMVISGLSFAACSIGNKPASNDTTSNDPASNVTTSNPSSDVTTTETTTSTPEVDYHIDLDDYKLYVKADLKDYVAGIVKQVTDTTVLSNIDAAKTAAQTSIEAGASVSDVMAAYKAGKTAIAKCVPYANGIQSFSAESNEEKTDILGTLEAYAVRNGMTGISLFENGGYVMYNPRVKLGTENYIPGYGFGTLAEGSITADLANETNPDWKRYYHSSDASDPGTANYLNDNGSQVADYYGYMGASFFTTFMNETKDGYDWVPELAKELPVAVNEVNGQATKWKFEVKTGASDGLKYNTNSTKRAKYNNRLVAPEDYITPFKLLLTQSNDLFRGSEMAGATSGAIKGAKSYYDASKSGFNEEAWKKVGLGITEEGGKTYFNVEFTTPLTQFYAMYYIASNLYMPVPQEFIDEVTVANYLGYNADKTETPIDNSLSLGAYTLEAWETDKHVVYKKNPNYVFASTKYQIPGVKVSILKAAASDETAVIKEFIANNLDASGIPQTMLEDYKNDPRTRKTTGDSNFKLNVNACSQETWEYLFGENGVVAQTPKAKYWQVKPYLGNSHFIKALSLSIDRNTFADARGSIPSVDWLSSNYMSDPVNGISYSTTQAHKDAVAGLLRDTDNGYSLDLARDYFRVAISELEAEGKLTPGTTANPTVLPLEIAWMYPQHEKNYHNEIKQYFEAAFNDVSVTGGKYKLEVSFWVGSAWKDVYYKKMMLGQFDLGFGSISGNALNPLDFCNVLSSDQSISGGFTLNWGLDTNNPDADALVYNGARWSFDALYTAANSVAIVNDGVYVPAVTFVDEVTTKNADGTITSTLTVKANAEGVDFLAYNSLISNDDWTVYEALGAAAVATVDNGDGTFTVTITVSAALVEKYGESFFYEVLYITEVAGIQVDTYVDIYVSAAVAE